jgi:hypothetical protein
MYVYTFVLKKVWDQFNESISSDIILKVTVKIFTTSTDEIKVILIRYFGLFYLFKLNLKTTSATNCRRCINHV